MVAPGSRRVDHLGRIGVERLDEAHPLDAQRRQQAVRDDGLVRPAGDLLDQQAEEVEVEVRVLRGRTRCRGEVGRQARWATAWAGVDTATEERPLVARESTRVRQRVADGDRRDRRVGDRRVDELCQGVANRSVELDLPGLDELQRIQATVPRNSVTPMISKARRTPTPRSRLLMPAKKRATAKSTTAST